MQVRTRFAPSPTGYLHVGGARTALYCWLYAKKHNGTFLLRIEDTDRERSTDEAIQAILDGMDWLELSHDEGPYYQTHRFARYQEVTLQLLNEGKAYRCYCSKERLEKLREEQQQQGLKPRYDGHCRDCAHPDTGESFVVRFKNPVDGFVEFEDKVLGTIRFQNTELDDLIIARSDGVPTYNFTVVVDDFDMNITHVIRGNDHVNNTPRQINMLKALGVTPPIYAHVPMILGDDGKRLSKRHGAVSVLQYRKEGYLPHALLNYLVRLGWSHGDQEIFSREEMIELFDLDSLNKSPSAFNTSKLIWLNQHYMKTLEPRVLAPHLTWHMQQLNIDFHQGPALEDIIVAQRERVKTLREMAEKSRFFYENVEYIDAETCKKHLNKESLPLLKGVKAHLADLTQWEKEAIHHAILTVSEEFNVKMGKVAQPIRVAITGTTVSPPIDETLVLLGQEKTLQCLENAIFYSEQQE